MSLFEPIFVELNRWEVRYVVVGGLATVLRGYARLTADIDLVVDLETAEAEKAIKCLTGIGFQPRVPVPALDFGDPSKRSIWIRDKNMRVFPLVDPSNPMRQVDLFVESPIEFNELWNQSEKLQVDTTWIRTASIAHLIELKRAAARPQDLIDIEALQNIEKNRSRGR